jgi:hypothetical protein
MLRNYLGRWRHAVFRQSASGSTRDAGVLQSEPSPNPDRMRGIHNERERIDAEFERTARSGHVPAAALIHQLLANHRDELAEERRLVSRSSGDLRAADMASSQPPSAGSRARIVRPQVRLTGEPQSRALVASAACRSLYTGDPSANPARRHLPRSPAVTKPHALPDMRGVNDFLTTDMLPCVVDGLRQGCTSSPPWVVTYLCTLPLPEPSYSQAYERGWASGNQRAGVG